MNKSFTILCALVCMVASAMAQGNNISVTPATGQLPADFVQNNLLGGGVYVFNAKYANMSGAISVPGIGTFQSNGFGGLSMQNGILMTTGDISLAVGPNDQDGASTTGNSNYSDPEMAPVASDEVNGCSTLDFDFVSLSNSVSFNYCFASEEYPEYVCSQYNDVFAFFLTGPDPETGEEVTRNIAIIPGTDALVENGIAVAINSVNPGVAGTYGGNGSGCYYNYTSYYVDNSTTDGSVVEGVQYDGYTSKLAASAAILPCVVYHMHISVCNVGDNSYDSGVFLEGGSFAAPSAAIGLSRSDVQALHGSCPYRVPLTLGQTDFDEGWVHFSFGGTAVEGQDFELVDEQGNPFGAAGMAIDRSVRNFVLRGLPDADLSQEKTIELYLATSLCTAFPQLVAYDTMRFTLDRGGDVRLKDTVIRCSHACFEVGTDLVYGEGEVSYRWEPTTGLDDPYSLHTTAMIFEDCEYRLIATGGSGCNSDTATVRVVITGQDPVDIADVESNSARVYPNPASDVILVEAEQVQRIEVFSAEGRRVLDRRYADLSGTISLPTEGLSAGTYGVRISTARGVQGAKIVVNK